MKVECDPKHTTDKHHTNCWEKARHCWSPPCFPCAFWWFHLGQVASCCCAKCLLSHVFTTWNFLHHYCLRADDSWRLAPGKCALARIWIVSARKGVGTGPAVKPFQSISGNDAHTWQSSQTLSREWSTACCREIDGHIPSAPQLCAWKGGCAGVREPSWTGAVLTCATGIPSPWGSSSFCWIFLVLASVVPLRSSFIQGKVLNSPIPIPAPFYSLCSKI